MSAAATHLTPHVNFRRLLTSRRLPAAKMPTRILYRSRTYAADYLFDMPILGTITRAGGHFPVAFKGKADGDFSVDRAKMAQIQTRVDNHIQSGGMLAFFPEGQLNSNPAKILVCAADPPSELTALGNALFRTALCVMLTSLAPAWLAAVSIWWHQGCSSKRCSFVSVHHYWLPRYVHTPR